MVFHVKIDSPKALDDKITQIEEINAAADKQLTTKLGEKQGKLEGRFMTFLKDLVSVLPGVHMARTTPKGVANAIAHLAKDHSATSDKKWLTLDEKDRLETVLHGLKNKIKLAKGEPYLEKHKKGIDKAISMLHSVKTQQPALATPGDAKKYLFNALETNTTSTVEKMEHALANGIDVNVKNNGDSALCVALRNKNKSAVEFLINKGADMKEPDSTGHTPLYHALETVKRTKNVDTLSLILGKMQGVNADTVIDNRGYTVKEYLAQMEQADMDEEARNIRIAIDLA